jgi:hypothetical protein
MVNQSLPFGKFTDQLLQSANDTFAVMHHKFLKEIWGNNHTVSKLHANQTYTDWQNGRYEVYIPSRDNPEYNLNYSRIAIQIQELNSNDTKHAEAYKLMEPIKQPFGLVDSELLILIAPHQDRWGLVKGFKHRNKPGYFTAVFTNTSPEIIWKRVLDLIMNFTQKRLDGIFKAMGFETWVWKWAQNKDKSLYYRIVEHFSYTLRQSVFTLLEFWQHLRRSMQLILNEIGIANTVKQAVRPLLGLNLATLQRVFNGIREDLQINLMETLQPCKGDKGMILLEALARR